MPDYTDINAKVDDIRAQISNLKELISNSYSGVFWWTHLQRMS